VGGYGVLRDCVRDLRPPCTAGFEVRFETPPGEQVQFDFARFEVEFADDPGVKRIVWLLKKISVVRGSPWLPTVRTFLACDIHAKENGSLRVATSGTSTSPSLVEQESEDSRSALAFGAT
jgi:hypothetical protein